MVFLLLIIPNTSPIRLRLTNMELSSLSRDDYRSRANKSVSIFASVFLGLGALAFVSYLLAGMNWFDATNYSMSTTATGGFSTHSDSTGYYHSALIDYTTIVFMFLSGVSFTMLYSLIFKGRVKQFFKNTELKLYCLLIVVATTVITYFLLRYNEYTLSEAIKNALFQVVSFITTTGVFNDDAAKWHHITWVVLSVCMFFGGCAGSTAGGFKCVRGVMVLKIVQNELKHILHPKAVLPVKVNGTSVAYGQQMTLMAFFAAYFMLALVSYFIMILAGVDSTNSFTIALSCASNVGPTLGLEIGPTMSWDVLPDIVKWLLSLLMLMGRLEIFSVVVLFTPSFWRDN